jgi:hypothetical protein
MLGRRKDLALVLQKVDLSRRFSIIIAKQGVADKTYLFRRAYCSPVTDLAWMRALAISRQSRIVSDLKRVTRDRFDLTTFLDCRLYGQVDEIRKTCRNVCTNIVSTSVLKTLDSLPVTVVHDDASVTLETTNACTNQWELPTDSIISGNQP